MTGEPLTGETGASGSAEADWEPGVIPRRDTEWETPFPSVVTANEERDAVRFVATYSVKRRKIALIVTGVAIVAVAVAVVMLVIASFEVGFTENRKALMINYVGLLLLVAFVGTGTWAAWKWANEPLSPGRPPR